MILILGLQEIGLGGSKLWSVLSFEEEYGRGLKPQLPSSNAGFKKTYGAIDGAWILSSLDAKLVKLEEYEGKVVFLNIWATWCGPCIAEIPYIQSLMGHFEDEVVFLMVTAEDEHAVGSFLEGHDYPQLEFEGLPVYLSKSSVSPPVDMSVVPTTFIIDKKGKIRYRHEGIAEWDREEVVLYLERLIREAT